MNNTGKYLCLLDIIYTKVQTITLTLERNTLDLFNNLMFEIQR